MVKTFKIYSLKSSKSNDLDKAAAIENDENMIINSDHSIITTPIESPQTDPAKSNVNAFQSESDETPTSEGSEIITIDKSKKRQKARSNSYRSAKYEHFLILFLFSKCVVFLF